MITYNNAYAAKPVMLGSDEAISESIRWTLGAADERRVAESVEFSVWEIDIINKIVGMHPVMGEVVALTVLESVPAGASTLVVTARQADLRSPDVLYALVLARGALELSQRDLHEALELAVANDGSLAERDLLVAAAVGGASSPQTLTLDVPAEEPTAFRLIFAVRPIERTVDFAWGEWSGLTVWGAEPPLCESVELAPAPSRTRLPVTIGSVELLGPSAVVGILTGLAAPAEQIAVEINGKTIVAEVHWIEQPGNPASLGFYIPLPPQVRASLEQVADHASDMIAVFLNGEALPVLPEGHYGPVAPDALSPGLMPTETIVRDPGGGNPRSIRVDLAADFVFSIAIDQASVTCDRIRVEIAGHQIDAVVTATASECGSSFQIELPGFIWSHTGSDGCCGVQVTVGDHALPLIALTSAQGACWLAGSAARGLQQDHYTLLLGLEHARALSEARPLPSLVNNFFCTVADHFALSAYFGPGSLSRSPADSVAAAAPDIDRLLYKQALRDFNDRLPNWNGREGSLLDRMQVGLTRDQWSSLLLLTVSYFCMIGRFSDVFNRLPAEKVRVIAAIDDRWHRSTVLPFLVAQNDLNAAAEGLERLPDFLQGWLNTQCIYECVVLTLDQRDDPFLTERIVYALLGLLDSMNGDYWSRLSDKWLIKSLTRCLTETSRWSRWLRRDLSSASLRIYALNPSFWAEFATLEPTARTFWSDLSVSELQFERLRVALESSPSEIQALRESLTILEWLGRFGNSDARTAIREILSATISRSELEGADLVDHIRAACADHPAEAVRYAAFPGADEVSITKLFPGLRGMIIQLVENTLPQSARYELQFDGAAAFRAFQSAGRRPAGPAADRLLQIAAGLGSSEAGYVGFDLLASAVQVFGSHYDAGALTEMRRQVLAATKDSGTRPPAALLAGVAKLSGVSAAEPVLRAFLAHSMPLLEATWGADFRIAGPSTGRLVDGGLWGDTLVVIYSCRRYLDTRVRAIRESWMPNLVSYGVRCVIAVGDGDDTLENDVLALDVSDHYEDLPRKSLKLVDWVFNNTPFQYLIKIDDDCLLNPKEYFGSLSYKKHHYYGRILHRKQLSDFDRAWHLGRSQSERGRRTLDKSDTPSLYADGGSGYSLSRLAMAWLCDAVRNEANKKLIASSFMEDKLIGDLLASCGITPSEEDYFVDIHRRTFADAVPVSMITNTFLPSRSTPTKVAHLDSETAMAPAASKLDRAGLWPKKIWPSCAPAAIGYNSNQLQLISDPDRAATILSEPLQVVAVMRNEATMIPHFLCHYRKLGVKAFIMIDNLSDDGGREWLLTQPDVVVYSADTEYRASHYGVAWQQAVLAAHSLGKWVVLADLDEFLIFPDCETRPLIDYVQKVQADGFDAIDVLMVDMYPEGDLEEADFRRLAPFEAAPYFDDPAVVPVRLEAGPFGNSVARVSNLRHRLIPDAEFAEFVAQKAAVLRYMPWMRLTEGIHYVGNIRIAPDPIHFAHFKYHTGFKQKAITEVQRQQHFGGAAEYKRYLNLLAETNGNFFKPGLSRRYTDSRSFGADDCARASVAA